MKIYALISRKLVLTQFWPKVVSWRFEITTDEFRSPPHYLSLTEVVQEGIEFLTIKRGKYSKICNSILAR